MMDKFLDMEMAANKLEDLLDLERICYENDPTDTAAAQWPTRPKLLRNPLSQTPRIGTANTIYATC